jgi:hypothetical protein
MDINQRELQGTDIMPPGGGWSGLLIAAYKLQVWTVKWRSTGPSAYRLRSLATLLYG